MLFRSNDTATTEIYTQRYTLSLHDALPISVLKQVVNAYLRRVGAVLAFASAREVDGGSETVSLTLPAIVTTDLRLNEPRYASLPNIMKAKSKPLANKTPADYGVDVAPRLTTLKVSEPPVRSAGIKVADVDELVAKLKAMGVTA